MVEPPDRITKITTGVLEVGGRRYYSLPVAAKLAGVSRATMLRWFKEGRAKSLTPRVPDIPIGCYRDSFNGRYYVTQETVDKLVNRLIPVEFDINSESIENVL